MLARWKFDERDVSLFSFAGKLQRYLQDEIRYFAFYAFLCALTPMHYAIGVKEKAKK